MSYNTDHYQAVLDRIVRAEREGAALILQAHEILAEAKTDRRNVVTEYDRRVQELLMTRLREALPDARFFCEEMNEQDDLDAEQLFIIDPIDGTMNFVHGFHHSCISVAYAERGVVRAGAIYNPYVDEMFTAIAGQGARLASDSRGGDRPEREPRLLRQFPVCAGAGRQDLCADKGALSCGSRCPP